MTTAVIRKLKHQFFTNVLEYHFILSHFFSRLRKETLRKKERVMAFSKGPKQAQTLLLRSMDYKISASKVLRVSPLPPKPSTSFDKAACSGSDNDLII